MYKFLSKFSLPPVRSRIKNIMKFCDMEIEPDILAGITVFLGIIFSVTSLVLARFLFGYTLRTALISFVAVFFIVQILGYIWLTFRAESKGRFVEDILPDALLLMSMNIKSGMTTDRALIISARPEFGPLEKELTRAGKQVLAGKDIKQALLGVSARVKSGLLDRTMRLIIEGIESGGELSSLLQQTAEDIQNTKIIINEVRSNLLMYAIFIFFAVAVGAPLLFGISTHLVSSVSAQMASFQSVGTSGQMTESTFKITAEFLTMFAMISLAVTSVFGGLIIGIVKDGSEKSGIKVIPILVALSVAVFFGVRFFVASIFPAL